MFYDSVNTKELMWIEAKKFSMVNFCVLLSFNRFPKYAKIRIEVLYFCEIFWKIICWKNNTLSRPGLSWLAA